MYESVSEVRQLWPHVLVDVQTDERALGTSQLQLCGRPYCAAIVGGEWLVCPTLGSR